MGQKDSLIVIGRIGSPYGLKGWVHVQSFTALSHNILRYKTWFLNIKQRWQPVKVLQAKAHNKHFVAHLEGYETVEKAALLRKVDIGIERLSLPALPPNEYYWADLLGMTVLTQTGVLLGTLIDFMETGSNDVLVVQKEGDKKQHLIPYILEDYVVSIDLETRTMVVNWDPDF